MSVLENDFYLHVWALSLFYTWRLSDNWTIRLQEGHYLCSRDRASNALLLQCRSPGNIPWTSPTLPTQGNDVNFYPWVSLWNLSIILLTWCNIFVCTCVSMNKLYMHVYTFMCIYTLFFYIFSNQRVPILWMLLKKMQQFGTVVQGGVCKLANPGNDIL